MLDGKIVWDGTRSDLCEAALLTYTMNSLTPFCPGRESHRAGASLFSVFVGLRGLDRLPKPPDAFLD
jgi:hypothetical protein